MFVSSAFISAVLYAAITVAAPASQASSAPVSQVTCNRQVYAYQELAGYGLVVSDARDKYGDTLGGFGSSIALEKKSWRRGKDGVYEGILWGLPDRGWNTLGTQNTQARIHKFKISFKPISVITSQTPSAPNLQLKYLDTVLLSGPDGTPCTGLDADVKGHASFPGFPDLPVTTYSGDGFGGAGPGGKRISVDAEGLVLGDDGSFWVSDEYGPYVYQFDKRGKMVDAIRPPDAFLPVRNGSVSFNANSPPIYDLERETIPGDPATGRSNNQGFEGLTASPDGKTLFVLIQSALRQEGGSKRTGRRHARLLKYTLFKKKYTYEAQYVVPLPVFGPQNLIAAQSEIHYLSPTQILILARDSNAGHGASSTESLYRNVDIFDISKATNLKGGTHDSFNGTIAGANGVLEAGIVPATYCPWIAYNNNTELARFGLHNGGAQDAGLLNEKWESLALAPVLDEDRRKDKDKGKEEDREEYYLISISDNDYITQNGYINSGRKQYKDESGFDLDSQALVFRVTIPKSADPL